MQGVHPSRIGAGTRRVASRVCEHLVTAPAALVTGAGQGLGRAIAVRLANDGYQVWALDIDPAAAARTADFLGAAAGAITCDITDAAAVRRVAGTFERLDVLVNNAGIYRYGNLTEASAADVDDVLAVNLLGTLACIRSFAPALKAAGGAGGSVVNLSSVAAVTHSPEFGIYPVTKVAVEGLTRQLALELGPSGIRVNAVGPGFVRTEGTDQSYRGDAEARRARQVPLRRLGSPDDIADVVAFLAGPRSSYVSGQVIYVDGGLSAGRPGG
jgi:3-oxoacyl-[acyl-carrier protein] reductase